MTKLIQPKKSTPETLVLRKTLSGCNSNFSFSPKEEKRPYVKRAIIKLDTAKFLIQVAWEISALNEKRLAALSQPLSEIGKMLGGWHNQLKKTLEQTKQTAASDKKRQ